MPCTVRSGILLRLRYGMTASEVYELLAVFLTSTGVLGAAVSAVLACMLRRAKKDAEAKRAERIAMELQRLEGEERLSEVVLALAHVCTSKDTALENALRAYGKYLEQSRAFRNGIISSHTVK